MYQCRFYKKLYFLANGVLAPNTLDMAQKCHTLLDGFTVERNKVERGISDPWFLFYFPKSINHFQDVNNFFGAKY